MKSNIVVREWQGMENRKLPQGNLDVTVKELSLDAMTLEGLSLLPKLSSWK